MGCQRYSTTETSAEPAHSAIAIHKSRSRPLERTIDEVLTDEIFEQLYFLGRKPEDYFMVDVSLSGYAPGTFAYGNSGRKTVQDRRQTHISVKRIPPEEYGNYLLTS